MQRRLFAAAVAAYGAVWLAGWLWPGFGESFLGQLAAVPPFTVYLFEEMGIPGLTDRSRCDWMWCRPTILGIVVTTLVWLAAAWGASLGIVRLVRATRAPGGGAGPPPGPGP
jgi:hypothetical protein